MKKDDINVNDVVLCSVCDDNDPVPVQGNIDLDCGSSDNTMENSDNSNNLVLGDKCANCKRHNVVRFNMPNLAHLQISFKKVKRKEIKQRSKLRFTASSRTSLEIVVLCSQCYNYLTKADGAKYVNMWPSFLWWFMSNESLHRMYGLRLFRLIPSTWFIWWENHESNDPLITSFVRDVTSKRKIFKKSIKHELLSTIAKGCDEYLFPDVLCPWGCSEYMHKVGYLDIDIMLQRFHNKVYFTLVNEVEECEKVFSCRDDYLRDDVSDYDRILLNPEWVAMPSCIIDEKYGAVFLTCRLHTRGTRKKYVHVPRNPFRHNIPSSIGDQLCHAIIKPRCIKPMKASKYSNTYQMHEQRGSFLGIDTCTIHSIGNFSFIDPLLDNSEALTICNRSDIAALLYRLEGNKVLPLGKSDEMKENAIEKMKGIDIKSVLHGSTFVQIEDAEYLQKKINTEDLIKVYLDRDNFVYSKRNWVQQIVVCQKIDSGSYGAQFPILKPFQSYQFETKYLWILCRIVASIPELWKLIERKDKYIKNWDGWLLTFLSKSVFSDILVKSFKNPFQSTHVKSLTKLNAKLVQLGVHMDSLSCVMDMLGEVNGVKIFDYFDLDVNVNDSDQIIILTKVGNDGIYENEQVYVEEILHSFVPENYELRFIVHNDHIVNGSANNWNADCYMRHGNGIMSWWKVSRYERLPLQTNTLPGEYCLEDIVLLLYVKKQCIEVESVRNNMLQYIGGQTKVLCKDHFVPLIILPPTTKMTCRQMRKGTSIPCGKKVVYGCPQAHCFLCICNSCFSRFGKEGTYCIGTIDEENITESTESDEALTVSSDGSSNGSNLSYDESSFVENDESDDDLFVLDEEEKISLDNMLVHYIDEYEDVLEDEDEKDNNCVMPSTNSGDIAFNVEDKFNSFQNVDGHVILNQCGSLLSRKDSHLHGYRTQKHFLQRIASTVDNECVPLLYPEAMLFPSIFWSLCSQYGSYPGAIPASLLVRSASTEGFASMSNHVRTRLTSLFSTCSTNPTYISFQYDILSNLLLNTVDSRLIIARGLTCSDSDVGIRVKDSGETRLHDSIDSK